MGAPQPPNWWDVPTAGTDPTYGPNNKNANQPGYDANGRPLPKSSLPPGWVINPNTGGLIPPGTAPTAGGGIPIGTLFKVGDTVFRWTGTSITKATVAESRGFSGPVIDVAGANGPTAEDPSGVGAAPDATGGGGGGSATRLSTDDPRYWQLQYDQLAAQYMNMGLDAESARRQALTTLIANRNNLSSDVANTSANVAKTAAEFAANPRDAVAELMYRNQVGGSTPFGDMTNKNFGEYGKALADKAASIFAPVNQDLQQARLYRDSIPPVDFFGAETRSQLGLPPTPAQQITGAGQTPSAPAAAAPDILTQLTDRLKAMSPEDQRSFREYVTGGNSPQPMARGGKINSRRSTGNIAGNGGFGSTAGLAMGGSLNFSPADVALINSRMLNRVEGRHFENGMYRWRPPQPGLSVAQPFPTTNPPHAYIGDPISPVGPTIGTGFPVTSPSPIRMFANGGEMNFDSMFADRGKPGFSPSSSEGGTAMNLHERAVVVGESGHIYATLGEKRPDGSIRSESLQVKPLASEKKKDKALEDGKKAVIESQKQTLSHFDQGGTVNSTPDDFMAQLSQYLNSLGGSGGGTGASGSSLPSGRLLAGAPANALLNDPVAKDYTDAGYSALGIDPRTLWSDIAKFTPQSPTNNIPRVNF